MKPLILSILLVLTFSIPNALADRECLKYNPMADKWEYASSEDRIKYNAFENEWSHEKPDSQIRYNYMEGIFEYAD